MNRYECISAWSDHGPSHQHQPVSVLSALAGVFGGSRETIPNATWGAAFVGRASNGDAPSSPITAASLRKIRTYRSCQACRLSKTKCNGGRPKCARCEVKGAECLYDGGSAPRWTRSLRRTSKMELTTTTAAAAAMALKMNGVEEAEKSPQGPAAAAGAEHVLPSPISDAATSPEHDAVEHPLSWLLSPDLPSPRNLRKVVEQYFSNVHPLRCFAFVHKPSFMHQLDRGFTSDDESALLHVICAHGAK
ncbi:hypothetical protein DCS_02980 [Drechmeria coniospora]|uniref:Zn(2)-C6 fungal-type domain-containing protein n=1 Tax=Drechmeria coniospora TaxID=98403 RepID=A0A151GXL2_DRECN|nr:hypothetical protein DCS_02980 [Drechmeria coniospora]KYK61836.1 hypothetical protein DCS_02980 [Drechmeria coniospora]